MQKKIIIYGIFIITFLLLGSIVVTALNETEKEDLNGQALSSNEVIVYLVTNMYPYGDIVLPMMKDTTVSNKSFGLSLTM